MSIVMTCLAALSTSTTRWPRSQSGLSGTPALRLLPNYMGTSNGGRALLGILVPFTKLARRRSQVRTV